jgi:ring-1,2-phenylacetyl-CoA epoxidase subunit PaaC
VRLGDGTEESHVRVQASLDDLWRFTGELLAHDEVDAAVAALGVTVDHDGLRSRWDAMVTDVLTRATLTRPAPDVVMQQGGRHGRHTEHLGHMLATMQIVARSHPGATW